MRVVSLVMATAWGEVVLGPVASPTLGRPRVVRARSAPAPRRLFVASLAEDRRVVDVVL